MTDYEFKHSTKKFTEFFLKIKIISELFMDWMDIENLDEVTIFLAESIQNTVNNYEEQLKTKNKVNIS